MFAIYSTETRKILLYSAEYAEQAEGLSIAETSITDDLLKYDCYVKNTKFVAEKGYNIITAIESYKKEAML